MSGYSSSDYAIDRDETEETVKAINDVEVYEGGGKWWVLATSSVASEDVVKPLMAQDVMSARNEAAAMFGVSVSQVRDGKKSHKHSVRQVLRKDRPEPLSPFIVRSKDGSYALTLPQMIERVRGELRGYEYSISGDVITMLKEWDTKEPLTPASVSWVAHYLGSSGIPNREIGGNKIQITGYAKALPKYLVRSKDGSYFTTGHEGEKLKSLREAQLVAGDANAVRKHGRSDWAAVERSKALTAYRITFENGQVIETNMAAGITLEDAKRYYLGNRDGFELDENKPLVRAVKVEQIT